MSRRSWDKIDATVASGIMALRSTQPPVRVLRSSVCAAADSFSKFSPIRSMSGRSVQGRAVVAVGLGDEANRSVAHPFAIDLQVNGIVARKNWIAVREARDVNLSGTLQKGGIEFHSAGAGSAAGQIAGNSMANAIIPPCAE